MLNGPASNEVAEAHEYIKEQLTESQKKFFTILDEQPISL